MTLIDSFKFLPLELTLEIIFHLGKSNIQTARLISKDANKKVKRIFEALLSERIDLFASQIKESAQGDVLWKYMRPLLSEVEKNKDCDSKKAAFLKVCLKCSSKILEGCLQIKDPFFAKLRLEALESWKP